MTSPRKRQGEIRWELVLESIDLPGLESIAEQLEGTTSLSEFLTIKPCLQSAVLHSFRLGSIRKYILEAAACDETITSWVSMLERIEFDPVAQYCQFLEKTTSVRDFVNDKDCGQQEHILELVGLHGWRTVVLEAIDKVMELPPPTGMKWFDIPEIVVNADFCDDLPEMKLKTSQNWHTVLMKEQYQQVNGILANESETDCALRVLYILVAALKGSQNVEIVQQSVLKNGSNFTGYLVQHVSKAPLLIEVKELSVDVDFEPNDALAQMLRNVQILADTLPGASRIPFILTNGLNWCLGRCREVRDGKLDVIEGCLLMINSQGFFGKLYSFLSEELQLASISPQF